MTQYEGTKLTDFTPIAKVDALQTIDIIPGTGAEVPAGATITAHYTGALCKKMASSSRAATTLASPSPSASTKSSAVGQRACLA